MISRRQFLALSQMLGLSALLPAVHSACTSDREIKGQILGPNASLGHRLRSMEFAKATASIKTDYVIIGGGVAGLSAARFLEQRGANYYLLEMHDEVGGNALGGANSLSAFPWGAHYLPIPGNTDPELISFLKEADVITGVKHGLPVFNDYYLCHDPKERLYINHFWQEGIVPHEGVPAKDRDEIQRFLSLMHDYKMKTGADNRPAFSIPVDLSSQQQDFIKLDSISALDFLDKNNFRSPYLRWYVNYCCADDFGSSIAHTSAWAMIHYFSSRRGMAANAPSDTVLTWPEGNFWLINKLKSPLKTRIHTNALTYKVELRDNGVACTFFDPTQNTSTEVLAAGVIMATPQFITERILQTTRNIDYSRFHYAPWMVANMVINDPLDNGRGEPLAWDNVIYGSDSLGYVNAMHQNLFTKTQKRVITYYKPLLGSDVRAERMKAHQAPYNQWTELVLRDLMTPHRTINKHIEEMNVWLWGHGMIRPSPRFIWSKNRLQAQEPIGNKIFFAHSDLSGISIFEEAFYQGHRAAQRLLNV